MLITDSHFRNYNNLIIHKIVQNQKLKLQVLYAKQSTHITIQVNKIFKAKRQKMLKKTEQQTFKSKRLCETPQNIYRYTHNTFKSQFTEYDSTNFNEKQNNESRENIYNGKRKIPIALRQIQIERQILNRKQQSKFKSKNKLFSEERTQRSIRTPCSQLKNLQTNNFFIQCPLKSVEIVQKTRREMRQRQLQSKKSVTKNNSYNKIQKECCSLNFLIPKLQILKQDSKIQGQEVTQMKSIFRKKNFIKRSKSPRQKDNSFQPEILNLSNTIQTQLKKSVQRGKRFQTTIKRKYRKTHQQIIKKSANILFLPQEDCCFYQRE